MTIAGIADLPGYTERFVGRQWVLSHIGEWIADTGGNALLVTGPPGSGKSAIAAELVKLSSRGRKERPESPIPPGFLMYHHFCQARDGRSLNPFRFLEGLAATLVDRIEGLVPYLIEHSIPGVALESSINIQHASAGAQVTGIAIGALQINGLAPRLAFEQMIARPLEELQVRRPLIVLIDALDEAVDGEGSALVSLVEHMLDYGDTLPLRFIITARTNAAAVVDRLNCGTVDIIEDVSVRRGRHLPLCARHSLRSRASSACRPGTGRG